MGKRTCSVDGCDKKHNAHGYCGMHEWRWKKYGDPLAFAPRKERPSCSVDGCDREVSAYGLCHMHDRRLKRTGTTDARPATLRGKFEAKAAKGDGCWVWKGSVGPSGYGGVSHDGKKLSAHRVSYELHVGPIPPGMFIDHICHNRTCVNPDHLRIATPKQNQENYSGLSSANTSGKHGVSWDASTGKWWARVRHNRKLYSAGYFEDLDEAGDAARDLRNRLHQYNDMDRVA